MTGAFTWTSDDLSTRERCRTVADAVPYAIGTADALVSMRDGRVTVSLDAPPQQHPRLRSALERLAAEATAAPAARMRVLSADERPPLVMPCLDDRLVFEGSGLAVAVGVFASLLRVLDEYLRCRPEAVGAVDVAPPTLLRADVLDRVGYFRSFAHHVTSTSVARYDLKSVEEIATATSQAARDAEFAPTGYALAPAGCLHVFAMLASSDLDRAARFTLLASCGRHEAGARDDPFRLWAYRLREIVIAGTFEDVERAVTLWVEMLTSVAIDLGLPYEIRTATDAFFGPNRVAATALQSRLGSKVELCARMADGSSPPLASVNAHATHFGASLDISIAGATIHSACVGFGIERLALAVLAAHGDDPSHWPACLRVQCLL